MEKLTNYRDILDTPDSSRRSEFSSVLRYDIYYHIIISPDISELCDI